jgi:acyl-CoA dehydrogenase
MTAPASAAPGLDFQIGDELRSIVAEVRDFVATEVMAEESRVDVTDVLEHWHVVEALRDRARARGIFAPHMPAEWGGLGLGAVAMALISQECGASTLAPLALNAMAPDEGNMHTLLLAGTPEQQERFLRPLAEGRTRSCFAMTEPDVASSDPLNLRTVAIRDGDGYLLRGHKWFITGAIGAAFAIVVAKTGAREDRHRGYSLFLVPTDTPGWTVLRDPGIIGAHYPGGHPEILLDDVRIPHENLLGELGAGFRISQQRLARGRLAHAMRWIGVAQRALDLAAERMLARSAFGKPLADQQALQFFLADSATELYASRLMVLHAAWKVDQDLPCRPEIAMVKTFVSEMLGRVLDRALQVFGSHGMTTDHPIGQWYADARAARIYDGASEVHRMTLARELLRLAGAGSSTSEICGVLT